MLTQYIHGKEKLVSFVFGKGIDLSTQNGDKCHLSLETHLVFHTFAVNTCRDMQRGSWFRHIDRRVSLESLPGPAIQPTDDHVELTLALMNLPRKLREALTLYYYQDMSTTEIAETLGIAQSSVSNRLRRGRDALRKALERREDHA